MSDHIVERKIICDFDDIFFLNKQFDKCLKIYNIGVKHINKELEVLYKDEIFNKYLEDLDTYIDDFYNLLNNKGLNEYGIQEYLVKAKKNYKININIVQKIGTNLNKSLYKLVFKKKFLNFKKYGQLNSFEGKTAKGDIIYKDNAVKVLGRTFKLKKTRDKDYYLKESLKGKIAFCRIVRKASKTGFNYYLQIVIKGPAPKKLCKGSGKAGLDQGISTLAVWGDEAFFYILAEGVEKYDKEIKRLSIEYNRKLKLANKDKLENGKFKKGVKLKKTKSCIKILFKLKNAYRRKSCFVKDSNRGLNNILISSFDTFITEDMDYRAFTRRSKKTERSDKPSVIKGKEVYKFKKKKRFGSSILRRNPGFRQKDFEEKCKKYGCKISKVERCFCASKFNHITGKKEDYKLSDRSKIIGNSRVQRDLYSAFLLKNAKRGRKEVDIKKCNKEFDNFLDSQIKLIKKIKDTTGNFGLKDFKKQ